MNYLLEGQTSQRLCFRLLTPADADTWIEFCRHPLSNKYWHLHPPETPDQRCKVLLETTFDRYASGKGGMNVLIDKQTRVFIGLCGLLIQVVDGLEELEVGYAIMPDFWNRGYATEAASKCVLHAFENGWRDSVISIIHEQNIESQKVALKNKMKLEKATVYKNNPVKIFRITKKDHSIPG